MQFRKSVGIACASFAVTNIDDFFVLATFFSEASIGNTVTPPRIVLGQYIGFTAIVAISLIGYGAAILLPTEPIGFLGFVPMLLGVWRLFEVLLPTKEAEPETSKIAGIKSILKVSIITLMNGGDNIGTYIPLFSQARKAEIAVYIVIYYILLGVWCLAAFLVMRQKHILSVARRYMHVLIPFLYIGLGLYIIIKSSCYPWSIEKIDKSQPTHPGKTIMSTVTTLVLLTCIGFILWFKLRKRAAELAKAHEAPLEAIHSPDPTHIINGLPEHASLQEV